MMEIWVLVVIVEMHFASLIVYRNTHSLLHMYQKELINASIQEFYLG